VSAETAVEPINLLDPYLYSGDPWSVYRRLRNRSPAYRDVNGIWGFSRYRDVLEAEKNTVLYSSAGGSRPITDYRASMINKDDPVHSRQRRIVSSRFTPGYVRRHEDLVREVVTSLIDAIAGKGEAEVVADLAAPLPAMIICRLIGYDADCWPRTKWWSEATMAAAGFLPDDSRRPPGSEEAQADFAAETLRLVTARQEKPADDLMSLWCHTDVDGAPLSVEEILHETLLLVDGGAETTRSAIGQTVVALAQHPEQRARLIADPDVLRSTAVEEFIRWSSPILNMRRTVTADHSLHGCELRTGDEVLLMYASANRDERVFERPDQFDVSRKHNHHVAFGFGTHFCLGANLARLELRVLFEELLRRLPDYRLAPGFESEFVPGFFARTLREVRIEFTPERLP
jgi:cytochrome P450 family 142 subfamily A polypeptide 1